MSTDSEHQERAWIDEHFAGRLSPDLERQMRHHLAACQQCKQHYRRHLALARLNPRSLAAKERLGRGLGLTRPVRIWRSPQVLAPVGAVAAVLLVVAILLTVGDQRGSSALYTARGDASVGIFVYRTTPGKPPTPVKDSIERGDELAFAYLNEAGKKRLMVFGVDDTDAIYWFYPGWQQSEDNPVAVPIETETRQRELPEAVAHRYRGRVLKVYALFVDQPLTVRQVEEMVRGASGSERFLEIGLHDVVTLRIK
jgi:hypothetical protein